MQNLDLSNHQSQEYLASHTILKQPALCDHEEWQGWLFRVRGTAFFFQIRAHLLTSHVIDKDYPLTGVVICFTSVQVEKRVCVRKTRETASTG